MWQEVIVGCCVLLAAAYLLRRFVLSRQRTGCGSCSGCSNKACQK